MTDPINPIEFGRVIGHLESIQQQLKELKDRTVWRLDDIERRVETLEKYKEVDEKPRLADKMAERAVWAALAVVAGSVVGYFGG